MRLGSLSCAVALAALALSMPGLALADPTPQDISQARDLGQQAQAALDAGNFAESERLWTAASNLYPAAPTLTLGLARAQAKQGKYVLAKESYNKIIHEQINNASASQAFKDALTAAQSEVDAVTAKIAHVTITVDGGAPNATVTIDGEVIPPAGVGVPRTVDPGQHTVKAFADGYAPAETTFQVSEAGNANASLTLVKNATPPPAPVNPQPVVPPPPPKLQRDHTYAVVAFGVGGVGLLFGAITGAVALGKHGDLADVCKNGKCPSTKQSDVDSYHTIATLSTLGFIVAGAGALAGGVLWYTAPKRETAGVTWQPYASLGGAGLTGSF